ncbi:hypothetical protein S40285_09793, partial [Stachybotrys chlorohalonatus IBT 40285]
FTHLIAALPLQL